MPHAPPSRRPRRVDRDQLKHDVVLGLLSGLPLSVVARQHGTSQDTVSRMERSDPAFAEEIAAARALGWDSLAVECLEIIDDKSQDVVTDSLGVPHFNTAAVLRAKAQVETRLRLLASWDTGRYGPQRLVKVEGEVQVTQRHVLDPSQLDETQRSALRGLIEHAQAQGLIEPIDTEFEEADDPSDTE